MAAHAAKDYLLTRLGLANGWPQIANHRQIYRFSLSSEKRALALCIAKNTFILASFGSTSPGVGVNCFSRFVVGALF